MAPWVGTGAPISDQSRGHAAAQVNARGRLSGSQGEGLSAEYDKVEKGS